MGKNCLLLKQNFVLDGLTITFGKATLKVAISFVLNNCFVNFGNLSFRKITGISMGSQVVPFTTNLFLYYYENKWLLDTE